MYICTMIHNQIIKSSITTNQFIFKLSGRYRFVKTVSKDVLLAEKITSIKIKDPKKSKKNSL